MNRLWTRDAMTGYAQDLEKALYGGVFSTNDARAGAQRVHELKPSFRCCVWLRSVPFCALLPGKFSNLAFGKSLAIVEVGQVMSQFGNEPV